MSNAINTAWLAVETALAGITTGAGYNSSLASSGTGALAAEEVNSGRPAVWVKDISDSPVRSAPSTYRSRVTVAIVGLTAPVEGGRAYIRAAVGKLMADITKAMTSNPTLSGAVDNVRYDGGQAGTDIEGMRGHCELRFVLDVTWTEGTP